MKIKEMFKDDIDRVINGVIQVEQSPDDIVEQELREYVVTKELKNLFNKFFNAYSQSIDIPTNDIGVWISGFFGSGKSHFLKMLSYLLENRVINGESTLDYFSDKYDDNLSFMDIQRSCSIPTETILFNIDSQGSSEKGDTAVLRVLSKVFHTHQGYYGADPKVVRLEKYLVKQNKFDDFKQTYEKNSGISWLEGRETFAFSEDIIVETLVELNIMSESSAHNWFNNEETIDYSIDTFVGEVKEYVDSKGKNFRLLFMLDEVGQYIGENGDMLLNLQTIVEKLGSQCRGQVWVVATGQEALDKIIKLREDQMSKIMGRFPIRLNLTSSSVDEVIEKRLLTKNDDGKNVLRQVYENNESVLSNLYAFDSEVNEIKGFSNCDQFINVYPFVPYQFNVMQKVFNEIRIHGHAGKNESKGERSMLNGFQSSARSIENNNELSIAPFYLFYDTIHGSLDSTVRLVVENCQKNVDSGYLKQFDVNLLKLLYLIRYVDEVKSNIKNLTILMADTINTDIVSLRNDVSASLERLQRQNYVSRNGDTYEFLTHEEQDVAREINNVTIEQSAIIEKICDIIFGEIYTPSKYRYCNNDFMFDRCVDNKVYGKSSADMKLHFYTSAESVDDFKLLNDSLQSEAILRLSDDVNCHYYENIERQLKISSYVKKKRMSGSLPSSLDSILRKQQDEAARLEKDAKDEISDAIQGSKLFICGQQDNATGSSAKAVIENALEKLVDKTFSKFAYIDTTYTSDADIKSILNGGRNALDGMQENAQASEDLYEYLKNRPETLTTLTMSDIHDRYQSAPYGWKEIDVAGVVAWLIHDQKLTIKHHGQTIQPNDYKIVDYLRKKDEIGNTKVLIREKISSKDIAIVKDILKEYFDVMDIPSDEDGLVKFIVDSFTNQKAKLENYQRQDLNKNHPGSIELQQALDLAKDILSAKDDNITLVKQVINHENDLYDLIDKLKAIEDFRKSQITLYDNAVSLLNKVTKEEAEYLYGIEEVKQACDNIKDITQIVPNYRYCRIQELNNYISIINDYRRNVINQKVNEIESTAKQCIQLIQDACDNDEKLNLGNSYIKSIESKVDEAHRIDSLTVLASKSTSITDLKDKALKYIENLNKPVQSSQPVSSSTDQTVSKPVTYYDVNRNVVFDTATLTSEQDIEDYINKVRNKLLSYLNTEGNVKIK